MEPRADIKYRRARTRFRRADPCHPGADGASWDWRRSSAPSMGSPRALELIGSGRTYLVVGETRRPWVVYRVRLDLRSLYLHGKLKSNRERGRGRILLPYGT